MKKIIKFFGIIAIAAVIGFSMAACKEPDVSDLDGTWLGTDTSNTNMEIRIVGSDGSFTQEQKLNGNWTKVMEGTYPADAKSPVTITVTRVNTVMFGKSDE